MQVSPLSHTPVAALAGRRPSTRETAFEFQASSLGALMKPLAAALTPKDTTSSASGSAFEFYASLLTEGVAREAAKGDYLKLNGWFDAHAAQNNPGTEGGA